MSKRNVVSLLANWLSTVGAVFVIYQNHFETNTAGTIGVVALIIVFVLLSKKYKEAKEFCTKEGHRLRTSDNMRIPTALRPLLNFVWKWSHRLLPFGLIYYIFTNAQKSADNILPTLLIVLIILGLGALLDFASLFVAHGD